MRKLIYITVFVLSTLFLQACHTPCNCGLGEAQQTQVSDKA